LMIGVSSVVVSIGYLALRKVLSRKQ
jgi:hypothetical protein